MKKITLFILTIFTVGTLFAAARPSLDGRAVVAEGGTMPKGLFARTVGYLPGDSVTVTNPATGSTIDVLILGAIDPSEGVAILLSPEAADGLRIKPDSNVQVKLTKRSGSLDENANGSAVISEGEDETPAVTETPAVAEETPAKNEVAVEETPAVAEKEPVEEIPVVAETPAVTETPAVEEAPVVAEEEPVEETLVVAEKTDEKVPVEEEAVEETAVVAEKPVEEVPVVVAAEPVAEEQPAKDEVVPETVYEELPPLPKDEKLQKVVVVKLEEEEPKLESETESLAAVEEIPASEVNAESEQPVALEEIPAAETVAESEQPVEIEEIPGVETEPVVVLNETPVEEENTDAYQPIVLVPAEPNPPAAEELTVEESTPVAVELEAAPVKEEAPKVVVSNDWTNYVVPSSKNLRRGSYYVQVASLGNTDNIKSFVDKYSAKYPVVLVRNSSTYQVMVGPLNIDEYGAVGEKFKDYGFKDSFVRKIK